MNNERPVVVIIDNDPATIYNFNEALSGWEIITAIDAMEGIALIQTIRPLIDIVILGTTVPHDGIIIATQLRSRYPDLVIVPYTDDKAVIPWFIGLGCSPLLPKPAANETISETLKQALIQPIPDNTFESLMPYLLRRAAESERVTAEAKGAYPPVVILSSSTMLAEVISRRIRQSGGRVRGSTTSATLLRQMLRTLRVTTIVADSNIYMEAKKVAQDFGLPLLVLALSFSIGYRVWTHVEGVLIEPSTTENMTEALLTVSSGRRYFDPKLEMPIAPGILTRVEYVVLLHLLQGKRLSDIALALDIRLDTVNRHQANIYTKLQVESIDELRELLDGQWPFRAKSQDMEYNYRIKA